jgi:hypothetical protein
MSFWAFASLCALSREYPSRQNHGAALTEETPGLERTQEARRGAGGTLKVTGVTPRVLNRQA